MEEGESCLWTHETFGCVQWEAKIDANAASREDAG